MTSSPLQAEHRAQIIAFVSGKGGSGKTLIAATMANHLAEQSGRPVFVVDADLATGGMTYYLGFKLFQRTAVGLSDAILALAMKDNGRSGGAGFATTKERNFKLMPVGDHRALMRFGLPSSFSNETSNVLAAAFQKVVFRAIAESGDAQPVILVDCRGGMDEESVEICRQASDIVLVAETDATSIQASQHLVDILSDKNVAGQLRGFILNKVFDNPSQLAKAGASLFRCSYLGAVPFDLAAVRSYVQGELPKEDGLFGRQVSAIVDRRFEELSSSRISSTLLDDGEFSRLSLDDPDERLGSALISALYLYLGGAFVVSYVNASKSFPPGNQLELTLGLAAVALGLFSSAKGFRKSLGRMVRGYLGMFRGVFRFWIGKNTR